MVAGTDERLAEADSVLAMAAEQGKPRIYLTIHRDIAVVTWIKGPQAER